MFEGRKNIERQKLILKSFFFDIKTSKTYLANFKKILKVIKQIPFSRVYLKRFVKFYIIIGQKIIYLFIT